MRWKGSCLGLALLVGAALLISRPGAPGVAPVGAAEKPAKGAPTKEDKTEADVMPPEDSLDDPVARIGAASRLAEYGRTHKSPASLINAAVLLRSVPAEKPNKEATATTENEKGEKVTAQQAEEMPNLAEQAEALLKEAKKVTEELAAEKNPKKRLSKEESAALLALADALLSRPATRGAIGGPKYMQRYLRPGQVDVLRLNFHKNQWARVAVRPMGNTHISLFALNHAGVVRASDGGPCPTINWMPHQRDQVTYTVRVRNNGRKPLAYQLFTN